MFSGFAEGENTVAEIENVAVAALHAFEAGVWFLSAERSSGVEMRMRGSRLPWTATLSGKAS